MTATLKRNPLAQLTLHRETAADLMTPNPVSLRANATVREALALLTERGFTAAPVIDEAGLPVGVLSATDILVHKREQTEHMEAAPEFYHRADLRLPSGEEISPRGMQVECVDPALVSDMMTPAVFSVAPDAPAGLVVERMVTLKVHRLFVVDEGGVLVGVISALDILRHLK